MTFISYFLQQHLHEIIDRWSTSAFKSAGLPTCSRDSYYALERATVSYVEWPVLAAVFQRFLARPRASSRF